MIKHMMNRSKEYFLGYCIIIAIVLTFSSLSFAGPAKNIILMIGDGMGPSHVGIAWLYATRQLGKNLVMTEVMNQGQTAYMVNDTADSTVTESAAAAVQMATGVKVLAKSIGIGPDGKTLKTILEMAREKETGRSTYLLRMQPGVSMPPHFHHDMEQCLVLKGDIGWGDLVYEEGDFIVMNKGTKHPEIRTVHGNLLLLMSGRNDFDHV